jgi:hypothetical protein
MADQKKAKPNRAPRTGETEFGGINDADKTVGIEPRPLRTAHDRIRAQNLTGDSSGNSPTDGGYSWNGLDRERFKARGLLPEQQD